MAGTGTPAGFNSTGGGVSFDVTNAPAVTAGAYAAGDIVGGVQQLTLGRIGFGKVTLQQIQIVSKAAVTPTWTVHFFNAIPATPTNYEDNDAYSLAVADCLNWRGSLTGFTLTDHGTPNTWELAGLARVFTTDIDAKLYAVAVDAVGMTLSSITDLQFRFAGYQD